MNDEKIIYLIIGGINTLIGYSLFILLDLFFFYIFILENSYFYANIIARPIAILISYSLHSKYTFKMSIFDFKRLIKFSSGYVVAYILSVVLLPIMVEYFSIHPWLSNFILIIIFGIINFFYQKYWTFK